MGAALARSLFYDFHIFPKVIALYYTSKEAFDHAQRALSDLEIEFTLLGNPNLVDVTDLVLSNDIDIVFGQRPNRQVFESMRITHLPLAFPYFFNQYCFIPWPYTGIRGMLHLITELATVFNELTTEKGKWRYYPYFPMDDKYGLKDQFGAPEPELESLRNQA